MKISTNLILTALIYSSTILSTYAQLDLKLNVDNLVDAKPEVSVEFGADKFSLELTNGLIFKKWGEATIVDANGNETEIGVKRFGYNGMLRANYYFNPTNTLDGWHISPYTRYRFQNIKFEEPVINNRVGLGILLGRKGMINDQFGYQVEAGLGYWLLNNYKFKKSGEKTTISQEIPLIGNIIESFDKFDLPINISVFYRIGG